MTWCKRPDREHASKDRPPSPELINETMKIGRGVRFAMTLPPESDAHFAGMGISLGEENRPIFRYRPVGSTAYRVIYADLSVKDEDTAPDVPLRSSYREFVLRFLSLQDRCVRRGFGEVSSHEGCKTRRPGQRGNAYYVFCGEHPCNSLARHSSTSS